MKTTDVQIKEKVYVLKVIKGPFTGDEWSFDSALELQAFVKNVRAEGCGGLVAPGTLAVFESDWKPTESKFLL